MLVDERVKVASGVDCADADFDLVVLCGQTRSMAAWVG